MIGVEVVLSGFVSVIFVVGYEWVYCDVGFMCVLFYYGVCNFMF